MTGIPVTGCFQCNEPFSDQFIVDTFGIGFALPKIFGGLFYGQEQLAIVTTVVSGVQF